MSLEAAESIQAVNENKISFSSSIPNLNTKATNMAAEWSNWFVQFKIFLLATNLEEQSEKRKIALLLHNLGQSCIPIFNAFNLDIETAKYNEVVKKFELYFKPKSNISLERHNFFTRRQHVEESVNDYATILENLSKSCEFGDLRESLCKDIFVCGLLDKHRNIKEKLLAEGEMKLQEALSIARSIIAAHENAQITQQCHEDEMSVGAVKQFAKQNFYQRNLSQDTCQRCGQKHFQKCPALGMKCNACGKMNHFAKMCKSEKKGPTAASHNKFVKSIGRESDDNTNLYVGSVENVESGSKEWNVKVQINNKTLLCQVDTGAQANLMSVNTFKSFNIKLDTNVCNNLITLSGERLPVIGKVNVCVKHDNQSVYNDFFILNMNCNDIIGIELAKELKLISIVNNIKYFDLLQKYSTLFSGLGELKTKCKLEIEPNSRAIVDKPRRVAFSLIEPLKKELNRMIGMNVITEVKEATQWVNSIVLVTKADGSLRLCLDPRHLNKVIIRPRFIFPTIDECKSKMQGARLFSKLDASSGFWMMPLDEESSKLCTFGTPLGRFRFLRLPFGISAAPEIFHAEMVRLFGDIEGLIIYMDDFLIYSSNASEHRKILETVLERAKNVGLRFNKNKSKFFQEEIKFVGHVFNSNGVKPDPDQVEAILKYPQPKDVKELQSFLGMINYLNPFIKNLSERNKNLRNLLKADVKWEWSEVENNEFIELKSYLCKTPVLTYYDCKKPLTLSVDASKYAVGAVIMHEKQPIAFASASLTSCQSNYAQIEKELFAILFGCTKFHQYVYGRKVKVETDHKPLVNLFTKPLHNIPARLQRFMLRLIGYNLVVTYKPGKDLYIADALSRAPLTDSVLNDFDNELDLHCNLIRSQITLPKSEMDLIRSESIEDEVFQTIFRYIKEGWPKNKKLVEKNVQPYYPFKDDISEIDGLILKGNRILIPQGLRKKMLKYLHEGHMGIQACQNLAKNTVYWPNINNDIYNIVSSCELCLKYRNGNCKEELLSHEIVCHPWYRLGCDLFEFNKNMYILFVDYYSKFVEIDLLSNSYSSNQVILKCKSMFSRHGIPVEVVTDNGPPFNSKEFEEFCKNWNITHIKSSPYLSRSNGLAERMIQVVKKILYKCLEEGSDPYIGILHYRTTPKNGLPSPSELLMGRKLRTKLPTLTDNLEPIAVDKNYIENELNESRLKSAKNYNKNAKNLKPIEVNEKVYFKKSPNSNWLPGVIVGKCKEPRSFLVKDNCGIIYRRNRYHILKLSDRTNLMEHSTSNLSKEKVGIENEGSNVLINRHQNELTSRKNIITETVCTNKNYNETQNYFIRDNQGNVQKTRSGRRIVPPARLEL